MVANLTQILNFKANFHQEFELFKKKYADNGGHFKIVGIIKKNTLNLSTYDHISIQFQEIVSKFQLSSGERASLHDNNYFDRESQLYLS